MKRYFYFRKFYKITIKTIPSDNRNIHGLQDGHVKKKRTPKPPVQPALPGGAPPQAPTTISFIQPHVLWNSSSLFQNSEFTPNNTSNHGNANDNNPSSISTTTTTNKVTHP